LVEGGEREAVVGGVLRSESEEALALEQVGLDETRSGFFRGENSVIVGVGLVESRVLLVNCALPRGVRRA